MPVLISLQLLAMKATIASWQSRNIGRQLRSIQIFPFSTWNLDGILRLLQVYDDAIKEFTLANTLNPPDPEPDRLISRTYATIGDYAKALQYAETAVKDRPTDASLHGNYGVMFYRNFQYQQAVEQLSLAVNGGQTEDGFPIKGLPLTNDPRLAEYYYTYGLALARTNQCGKALQIAQEIQTKIQLDDPSMEIVNEGANRIIEICQENLDNPAVDTPAPTAAEGTVEAAKPRLLLNLRQHHECKSSSSSF